MKTFRPRNYVSFKMARYQNLLNYTECVECGHPFTMDNTKTVEGWKETQVSGLCECCYDEIFAEQIDEEESVDMKIKDRKEGV